MALTFAGTAAADVAYPIYNALKTASPVLGEIATAAELAAVAALLADGALIVGAGLAGYAIGEAILKQLDSTQSLPPAYPITKVVNSEGNLHVTASVTIVGAGALNFDNILNSPLVFPATREATGGQYVYGVLSGPNLDFVPYFQAAPDQILAPFILTGIEKQGGGQPQSLRKVPSLPPFPVPATPKFPGTITVPGISDPVPITPTVIPNPNNDPDDNDIGTQPGVLVKVPEAGLQFRYTPTGVAIVRYKDPTTAITDVPKVPPPPTTPKAAVEPCPCPEQKVDLSEVICRLKALEKGLLSDGFDYTTHAGSTGQGGVVSDIADELVYAEIQITNFAATERTQRAAPGTPTVYFIGWFSWIIGNFPSERTPISYLNHNFIAPPNATGYLYSLHDGASAETRYVTRKAKDYTDLC